MNQLTLVSALFESPIEHILYAKLDALKKMKISAVVYTSHECYDIIRDYCFDTDIYVMPPVILSSMWIYEIYEKYKSRICLPENRNREKDTESYILYRHAKHEFIRDAIQKNLWKSTHFMWMDFYMIFNFSYKESIGNYFQWMNICSLRESFLTMPGGWGKLTSEYAAYNAPYWRYCGVFLGDATSILEFCDLYKIYFPMFLEKHGRLVWEFNVWAWMEYTCGELWKAIWYKESPDMNELVMCSSDYYTKPVALSALSASYMDYTIPNYYASSSCYIYYKGEHYLNTRFVNYWIDACGRYIFYDSQYRILNKNVLSKLNDDYSPEIHWEINESICMNHPLCENPISMGLEDIRLFERQGKIYYVATTIGYTDNGRPRVIMGEYNIDTHSITSGVILQPPEDTYCEKNWVPIVDNENNELYFIYKWHPLEIGKIGDNHKLDIIKRVEIKSLIFRRVRGSTPFVETERGLLGVVHYSEEYCPRHYYHMLVVLDKHTLDLLEYSSPFCFEKYGIEFCIGFTVTSREYVFWISRNDRDPCMIKMSADTFVFVKYRRNHSDSFVDMSLISR